MIMQNTILCRGFVSCSVAFSPAEVFTHPNKGAGVNNQFIYLLNGSMEALLPDGNKLLMPEKVLFDMAPYMGEEIVFSDTGNGCYSFAINPIPETKRFTGELLTGATTKTITATQEQFVICLEKNIFCNSTQLSPTQYAYLPLNKQVVIDVPEGSAAAIFTTLA